VTRQHSARSLERIGGARHRNVNTRSSGGNAATAGSASREPPSRVLLSDLRCGRGLHRRRPHPPPAPANRRSWRMTTFASLDLPTTLRPGLEALGLTDMTTVQSRALPALLAGRDVLAQAPTGSGKTVAFALGLLRQVDLPQARVQALVLCPTRELADQVGKQIRKLGTGMANLKLSLLYGGVALGPQIASLEQHQPHVVVGTPGRIQELLRKRHLDLSAVRVLVLDEADRMLDMGFEEPIREIVGRLPATRQTLLFSATFPDPIRTMAARWLSDPLEVHVEGVDEAPEIGERFFEIGLDGKPEALARLLLAERPESCVVFCNTRQDVAAVSAALDALGFTTLALHGDMEQRDRDEVLLQFANRSCRVLVASDVASRGLDVEDLALVVNYELPSDLDTYRHRIGRTARAGRRGQALSLVTPREMPRALALESERGERLRWDRLPAAARGGGDALRAAMVSLRIDAGKTDKLRPGDILGALTGDAGLPASAVGRIDVFPTRSYVAVARAQSGDALRRLQEGRIKGRRFRVRRL
jgi:ATP-dependent RNA helicase DbpA